jgi:hypothetical protein
LSLGAVLNNLRTPVSRAVLAVNPREATRCLVPRQASIEAPEVPDLAIVAPRRRVRASSTNSAGAAHADM